MRITLITATLIATPLLDPRSPGLLLIFSCLFLLAARSLASQTRTTA